MVYRSYMSFVGIPQMLPTPLLTDNDGMWYVSKDAMGTTKMTYIIRHVRFLQEIAHEPAHVLVVQMEGILNPTDALTTWRDSNTRMRHYAFLRGQPELARRLWRESAKYKTYKPKKMAPPPSVVSTSSGVAATPRSTAKLAETVLDQEAATSTAASPNA